MGLALPEEHPLRIELEKWNKPYRFEPFPRMLYKAHRRPDGIRSVGETNDGLFGGAPGAAEQWTRTCQRTVRSESEMQRAIDEGWRETQAEAIEYFDKLERFVADAAAHRHHEDRNMSPAAKAEAEALDSGMTHLPEIPEAHKREKPEPKRGRRASA